MEKLYSFKTILNFYWCIDLAHVFASLFLPSRIFVLNNFFVKSILCLIFKKSNFGLVRNSLLDLIETPADTFDLKVFNSDSEYRDKFAEMFYEKTGIQLKERRFWEYYNNSVIDGENKKNT